MKQVEIDNDGSGDEVEHAALVDRLWRTEHSRHELFVRNSDHPTSSRVHSMKPNASIIQK